MRSGIHVHDRLVKWLSVIALYSIFLDLVHGYLPNNLHQCGIGGKADYTHESMITSTITEVARKFRSPKNNYSKWYSTQNSFFGKMGSMLVS